MVGHAGTGDETKVYPYARSLSVAELGLATLGLGNVPMRGYYDTSMIHHWPREPLELPPGSLQKVQIMGGGGEHGAALAVRCSSRGSLRSAVGVVQDDSGGGRSGCSLSLSSVSAMWHEQGAWEEPMQEADKRLQVAKAFFHTNLVTHPGPLPTRSSQAKFFRTHSRATEIRVEPRCL